MTEKLKADFLKKFSTDKKLQEDLAKSKSPKEAHKIVVNAGYDVSFDDFKTAMGQLNTIVNQDSAELSENDLEMVAGGRSSNVIDILNPSPIVPGFPVGPGPVSPIGPGAAAAA